MQTTRRNCLTLFAAALAANSTLIGKENNVMKELLESSQNDKKSVMLYVKGQSLGGLVTKMTAEIRSLHASLIH